MAQVITQIEMMRYQGAPLAVFKLSHCIKMFIMTALFTVMFVNQWEEAKDHRPALTGLGCAALCLSVFGSDGFMLPAMALIIVCFLASSKSQKKEEPAL